MEPWRAISTVPFHLSFLEFRYMRFERPFDMSKFRKEQNKSLKIKDGFFDPLTWIDSGNYALNKMICNDFYGGVPIGSVTTIAGEPGAGKSYIASGNIVRNALAQGVSVVLLDSESAVKRKWAAALGVDTDHPNLIRWSKNTINEVAKTISDFMEDEYVPAVGNFAREEQPPVLFVIDSLGNLETETGIEQFQSGDLKGDKGIFAKQLKMMLKNCMREFDGYQVGMVCTNHVYKSQSMFDHDDVITGGCLVAGTQVWLANGDRKPIERIELGDTVKTMNGEHKVLHLWRYLKPTYTLQLENGKHIQCSAEHRFLVLSDGEQIWKCASDIQEDDEIICI